MMNFYPFFGSPFYRKPSPYYLNNGFIYGARRTSEHNLNYNSTCSTRPNSAYNLKHNSHCDNLHNSNNFSDKNNETNCSPSISRSKKQEKFNNSNFSDSSSKNYVKSKNSNFKNFERAENTGCNKNNNLLYIGSCPEDNYSSDECFEIFGLKLHFDDLLIICILFFLYQEDVKDTYLYISLILLLLS